MSAESLVFCILQVLDVFEIGNPEIAVPDTAVNQNFSHILDTQLHIPILQN